MLELCPGRDNPPLLLLTQSQIQKRSERWIKPITFSKLGTSARDIPFSHGRARLTKQHFCRAFLLRQRGARRGHEPSDDYQRQTSNQRASEHLRRCHRNPQLYKFLATELPAAVTRA